MQRLLRRYRRHKKQSGGSCVDLKASRVCIPSEVSLDNLPYELKLAILHEITDLVSLRALTCASPAYREVYRSESHLIQSSVLLNDDYPDLLLDLRSTAEVMQVAVDDKFHAPEIERFVERCKAKAKASSFMIGFGSWTIETLVDVDLTVRHAIKQYFQFTLSCHPVTGEPLKNNRPVSHSEIRRIHRAFYRYELFCIIFRESDLSIADAWTRGDIQMACDLEDLLQIKYFLFIALFKAWEIEGIACIRDYIIRRYKALIHSHEQEFQKQCFRKVVPWLSLDTTSRTDTETWDHNIGACQEHYLSLGLQFFNKITEASPEQSFLILRNNVHVKNRFLSATLAKDPPGVSCTNDCSAIPIDEAELQEINKDLDGRPNAAWTWSNNYRDERWYFSPVTGYLRAWGYVFWDKERLDDWGVLDETRGFRGILAG